MRKKGGIELAKLPDGTKIYLQMNSPAQILRDKGLTSNGSVQSFHTANVMRRIKRYMPFLTGATFKVTVAQTDINKPEIVTDLPYAKYLYYGKVMVSKAPRVATKRDLQYTQTKNPLAGPYWDRRLVAAEGKVLAAELQRFIDRRSRP